MQILEKLAVPVLQAAVEGQLRAKIPDGAHPFAPLAATSRILASIAPWLELEGLQGEEAASQQRFRGLARAALASVLAPASPIWWRRAAFGPI